MQRGGKMKLTKKFHHGIVLAQLLQHKVNLVDAVNHNHSGVAQQTFFILHGNFASGNNISGISNTVFKRQ